MHFHGRVLVAASLALTLGLTACGSSASKSGSGGTASSATTTPATLPPLTCSTPAPGTASAAPTSTPAGATASAASASVPAGEATLPAVVGAGAATATTLATPTVHVPTAVPTKLVSTDLKPGSGDAAVAGDTVVVNYIGVTMKDGKTFDESYSKGQPLPVVLGQGSVIKGWDDGLVGVTAGMQRQLDIPSDLAYGAAGNGPIGPNEALSFVVDVVAVVKATIAPVTSLASPCVATDDVVGTGAALADGQTISLSEIVYNGTTGARIASTWDKGTAASGTYAKGKLLPGVYSGMAGMRVGGTRRIVVHAGDAIGAANATQASLPVDTVLVFVVGLVSAG